MGGVGGVTDGANTPLFTCTPESFTPIQPTSQERENSLGSLERLEAALGRNGPAGIQETEPTGESVSRQGGKCNPVNLLYILFEQHVHF